MAHEIHGQAYKLLYIYFKQFSDDLLNMYLCSRSILRKTKSLSQRKGMLYVIHYFDSFFLASGLHLLRYVHISLKSFLLF